ncbi:MAG: hypothetical protein U1A77_18820 [Pirellulales bacterium]
MAPSEIPGVSDHEASVFGDVAEELIYADFCSKYGCASGQVFRDADNPDGYLYFLARHNPQFTQEAQIDYYLRAWAFGMAKIPDLLVHSTAERAFYEVKPDSTSGRSKGVDKIDKLRIVYAHYHLPYSAGNVFLPRDHTVANFGVILKVVLRVRRVQPGLILYKLCLESQVPLLEVAALALLLRYVVREMNKLKGMRGFQPIDLAPLFARELWDLARGLGLVGVGVGAGVALGRRVGWRYFWKAVVKRFAVRGTAAAALSAADGPLPVGELISLGIAVWTVIDIVRLHDELWRDAEGIARAT